MDYYRSERHKQQEKRVLGRHTTNVRGVEPRRTRTAMGNNRVAHNNRGSSTCDAALGFSDDDGTFVSMPVSSSPVRAVVP